MFRHHRPGVRPAAAVGTLFALLFATACGAGTTDSAGSAGGKSPTVRLALGVDASYAPLYLAIERGMFKKAGVDVQLMKVEGGPAAAQAVTAGTAQMSANADSTALPQMVSNPALRALGVFQSSGRLLKVVLRKGITSPKQIRTMGSIQGIGLYATHQYLEHNGIDPDSVKIQQSSPQEIPTMLQRGDIDGYILFDPWVTKGVEAGGHIAGSTGDFGVTYRQWLLADQKWLKDHQDVAGKVFKVVAEADRLVTKDPHAAALASREQAQLPVAGTEKAIGEITFESRALTSADVTSSRKIVDFLLAEKLVKSAPDYDTVLLSGWYDQHAR
ncbi:ABC transporter substrate-binding protein [Streptomyces sp. VRA16 Mangrove soil]|uniref:ABC transporter substrate-binding protein n=1 Tax=Streptomyces sp. VRA16 Mangrove soil TaxID=2817434 RepID=UPI001AA0071D|nr:ABC transporter substrate-binding protein [Streptomyces sp. VRA16 Mangrove soil]MBO1330489.1 ABC transporter substrate-binding protein [Streptomyces sp. VRA16 Mangrove soil]